MNPLNRPHWWTTWVKRSNVDRWVVLITLVIAGLIVFAGHH